MNICKFHLVHLTKQVIKTNCAKFHVDSYMVPKGNKKKMTFGKNSKSSILWYLMCIGDQNHTFDNSRPVDFFCNFFCFSTFLLPNFRCKAFSAPQWCFSWFLIQFVFYFGPLSLFSSFYRLLLSPLLFQLSRPILAAISAFIILISSILLSPIIYFCDFTATFSDAFTLFIFLF